MTGSVAVDGRALCGPRSGIGVWLHEICVRWAAAGRDVTLLVERGAGPDTPLPVVEVAAPFHLNAARWVLRRPAVRYLSPDSLIVPSVVGRRSSVVVHDLAPLLHGHTSLPRTRVAYRSLLGLAARRCGAVVVPSVATRDDLLRREPRAASRVQVVAEAARTLPAPAPLPAGVRVPYLLFTGTLQPRKHPVELVEAFLAAAPEPWQLVLAGRRGWLSPAESARLDGYAGHPRVRELGHVHDAVLAGLLGSAGASAYPSSYEGFGLPVLEAMAAGVPVLTTTAPALREVAGDAALLVDVAARDAYGGGLRDALRRLLTDDALRGRLGEAGRRRAAAFSWDTAAEEVWRVVTGARAPGR